jgi:hypothetical protein
MNARNAVQRLLQQEQEQELNTRQARAVELYTQGSTDAEVAAELGVERSTVWRWRTQDLAFRSTLRRTHAKATKIAVARLEGLVEKALDVVAATLADQEAPLALRLRAAEAVLDRAGIESSNEARSLATGPFVDLEDALSSI